MRFYFLKWRYIENHRKNRSITIAPTDFFSYGLMIKEVL